MTANTSAHSLMFVIMYAQKHIRRHIHTHTYKHTHTHRHLHTSYTLSLERPKTLELDCFKQFNK